MPLLYIIISSSIIYHVHTDIKSDVINAWKYQSIHPDNYSMTIISHEVMLKTNCIDAVNNIIYKLKLLDDINIDNIVGTIENSGIHTNLNSSSSFNKCKVIKNGTSFMNTVYRGINVNNIAALFCKSNSTIIYRNDLNKSYDVYNTFPLAFKDINNVHFVPYGMESLINLNNEKSDHDEIHIDFGIAKNGGFCKLGSHDKVVREFRAKDVDRKAMRVVFQKGIVSSGRYSFPKCKIDYVVKDNSRILLSVTYLESIDIDNVPDDIFVIPYHKEWIIKDHRVNPSMPDIKRYPYDIIDVTDHYNAAAPALTSGLMSILVLLIGIAILFTCLVFAIKVWGVRLTRPVASLKCLPGLILS